MSREPAQPMLTILLAIALVFVPLQGYSWGTAEASTTTPHGQSHHPMHQGVMDSGHGLSLNSCKGCIGGESCCGEHQCGHSSSLPTPGLWVSFSPGRDAGRELSGQHPAMLALSPPLRPPRFPHHQQG